MLSVGIVGLPNVGKSTLFNALLKKQQAFVANYPFATIEPNVGVVPVPDPRLEKLADIVAEEEKPHPNPLLKGEGISISPSPSRERVGVRGKRPPIVPATVRFVDIAGLVKGAAEGAGLGNKFLSHIREVSIIAHVARAFDPSTSSGQEEVIRVGTDPKEDYETIQTELILADLSTISKIPARRDLASRDKNQKEAIEKLFDALNKGIPAREVRLTEEEQEFIKTLLLLSAKPEIVVLNVSEDDYSIEKIPTIIKRYSEFFYPVIAIRQLAEKQSQKNGIASSPAQRVPRNDNMVVICAKIEAELSELSEGDQKQYLKDLGLEQSGLERLIKKSYETLGLISFLTAGEKEVRAWTLRRGETALRASGTIHTDFEKKFIKAEVVSYNDFVSLGGWKGAREKGKARMEGRDYVMQDGDVVEFKIGS